MKNSATFQVTTPNDLEILVTRTFDAPRDLVFEAHTRPELLRRWLTGPPGWTMPECEVDARAGGSMRYVWRGPGGEQFGMRAAIHEYAPPKRVVCTEKFDMGDPSMMPEQHSTLEFVEKGGKTILTLTIGYRTKQERDGALASGMEKGMAAGYDRLDDLLQPAGGKGAPGGRG